ncbi:hypothetical protein YASMINEVIRUS_1361 [Yasminevirus sp. GU-2018]|uniref:Uncharacterized protein n=1 Tax=Yasminevirus sp. GU-2018 TaxID=2420051 RepID=A0A5K0U9S1_9VIRU|nr:hypothetical protein YASMINEVIRUS_1361 [Yasminevirus sp. GU-2018]
MIEFKFACSFGTSCSSAELIRRNNWRSCAYPFDWVFSSLDVIKHCITTDFSLLLDKSQYVDIQIKWNSDQCGHKTYDLNMFNHRDMREEHNYAYLTRCVERLRDLFKSKESKLFVLHFKNNTQEISPQVKNQVLTFANMLKQYTTNFHILTIWNISKARERKHSSDTIGVVNFLSMCSISEDSGMYFTNDLDNQYIDRAINTMYRFIGP